LNVSLLVAGVSWAGAVAASPSFPEALVSAVPMPDCTPGCAVCHRDNAGGQATATQKFAAAMLANGLVPAKPETVKTAVEALRAANTDTDLDMKPDILELAAGQNPNLPGTASVCLPTYGCGARIAPAATHAKGAAVALLGAAALVFLGRRARALRSRR